jgi:hypothetical protein
VEGISSGVPVEAGDDGGEAAACSARARGCEQAVRGGERACACAPRPCASGVSAAGVCRPVAARGADGARSRHVLGFGWAGVIATRTGELAMRRVIRVVVSEICCFRRAVGTEAETPLRSSQEVDGWREGGFDSVSSMRPGRGSGGGGGMMEILYEAAPEKNPSMRRLSRHAITRNRLKCAAVEIALLPRGTELAAKLTTNNGRNLLIAQDQGDVAGDACNGGVSGAQLQRAVVGSADDPVLEEMIAQSPRRSHELAGTVGAFGVGRTLGQAVLLGDAEGRVVLREAYGLGATAEDGTGAADVCCVNVHLVVILANQA